jgi:hypothetical protein
MNYTKITLLLCLNILPGIGYSSEDAPSFLNEVLPVLTRTGCNQGACHGKNAGQGQFKLSLRGYAPKQDYEWLAKEYISRRINTFAPENSLLLLKATAQVPHEGNKRFDVHSRYYETLSKWIGAGAPTYQEGEATLEGLRVEPHAMILHAGESGDLAVKATFGDGTERDVTWLSQFFTGDATVLSVTEEGKYTAIRPGSATLRVHFLDKVAVATFSIPRKHEPQGADFKSASNFIDIPVFAKLRELNIPPSGHCDDATFLRRASLDATGSLPSADQVKSFLADPSEDKRAKLVENLLGSPEFTDYWTLQLSDLFQNRKERDHDVRGTKGVRSFHSWLREKVRANTPWHQLTEEILTASGEVHHNPPVGYFITTMGESRSAEDSEVADSVAQAFLGTRIGCSRCHNHPSARYTQDDYYHFAAFFTRSSLAREKPDSGTTALFSITPDALRIQGQIEKSMSKKKEAKAALEALPSNAPEGDRRKAEEELEKLRKDLARQEEEYEKAHKKPAMARHKRTGQMMPPRPLDRSDTEVNEGADPRKVLADWLVSPGNEYFSGAIVNRIWKHYMGAGMVEPVDDLRPSNPPNNKALWDALRNDFIKNGYDLRHLMRQILNSRAYQLQSETLPENKDDRRFHSHYLARRLPAEVMLDALCQSTGIPEKFDGYPYGIRAIQLPGPETGSYFMETFGRSDRVTACACERQPEVTLPQVLHIRNSDDIQRKLDNPNGTLAVILHSHKSNGDRENAIFLETLGRFPKQEESQALKEHFESVDTPPWKDLFWALLNTKEFAFNH